MPELHRRLANKYEDIVNLQGAEAYCVARAQFVISEQVRFAQEIIHYHHHYFVDPVAQLGGILTVGKQQRG